MALLFIDGFDHYDSSLEKWDSNLGGGTYNFVTGRFSGFAVEYPNQNGGPLVKNIPTSSEIYMGFAFFPPSLSGDRLIDLWDDGSTLMMRVEHNASGQVVLKLGASQVDISATGVISDGQWSYIEFRCDPQDAGGTLEVWVNGVSVASFTGDTNPAGGNSNVARVDIFGTDTNAPLYKIDDLYILDTTGTVNNTRLGDSRIITDAPTVDTSKSDFVPLTGNDNFAMVDEINTIDNDTTYNENGTLGATDRFTDPATGISGTVHGVQISTCVKKTDAGARSFRTSIKQGTTTKEDLTSHTLNASYKVYTDVYDVDPDTGVAWTTTGVGTLEWGYKVTT